MKPAWEWKESDIRDLIANQVQESLTLEYKGCEALGRTDGKKKEISKDVSAFANSAGGEVVYGVIENKHVPTAIDVGYDPFDISKEWIEQVINSNVQRRIDGIRINQVQLTTHAPGNVLYVVSITQSVRTPHMAADHRFYKRFNFVSVPMEEYEVRDVGRRLESPDLHLQIEARFQSGSLVLSPYVSNRSAEPAFYAAFRLFLPEEWSIWGVNNWLPIANTILSWNGIQKSFRTFHHQWGTQRPALLEEERYEIGQLQISGMPMDVGSVHNLGYELRTPKMLTKLACLVLRIANGSPRVETRPHTLQRI